MEKKNTITALYVQVGKKPNMVEIKNDLESLQKAVDGYIEQFYLENEVVLICNEEGKIDGLQLNRAIYDENNEICEIIAGDFLVCYAPSSSEHFKSLPPKIAEKYSEKFKNPQEFCRLGNKFIAIPYKTHEVSSIDKPQKQRAREDFAER